jgi:hypothetical protein
MIAPSLTLYLDSFSKLDYTISSIVKYFTQQPEHNSCIMMSLSSWLATRTDRIFYRLKPLAGTYLSKGQNDISTSSFQ